jgi:hypothetical protein
MKDKDITNMAKQKAISIEKYNTNNAWGFGGGRGIKYNFSDGSYIKIGMADFRHTRSIHYNNLYFNDARNTENKNEIATHILSLSK